VTFARLVVASMCVAAQALTAQAPTITKVDPPNWWPGHSINPVRVLARGTNLSGATLSCGRLRCGNLRASSSGTSLFIDVTIPRGVAPGKYPLTVRTSGGQTVIDFTVQAPLSARGRFAGFSNDDVIYLIMPDRFANGDASNDDPAVSRGLHDRTKARYYHGGDLAGVRQRLPYLKSLGVTAIWLNPIYDNNNGLNRKEMYDNQPITDYHGYGATDLYAVDEHLGTLEEMRQLVDAAHAMGIKIILDMVANHTGPYHPWVTDAPTPTWYNGTADRHINETWQTWTLQNPYATPELKRPILDGWFIDILPDLNQGDPDVARYINQNTLWWVGMTGIDGIRQDTWPYVPRVFWRDWMRAIKQQYPSLRVVGEVFDGDPAMVSFFQGGRTQFDGIDDAVDYLFDFPMFYPIRNAFAGDGQLRNIAQMFARDHLYPDANRLVTFLGLHDVQRFMSEPKASIEGLLMAYTVLFTSRGTPLIYYGDEIALPGGNDPDNRRDFPGGWAGDARNAFEASGRDAAQQRVFAHVQALTQLRAARPELRRGRTEHLFASEQQFVYRRGGSIIAINNDTAAVAVAVRSAPLPSAAIGNCTAATVPTGEVKLSIPARTSCVF
jgi:neopullulanase